MIRCAVKKDYATLSQLWLKASLKAHSFIADDYWIKMTPEVAKYYLPNSQTYVFEDRHQLKGFISLTENNFIGALFVANDFQNQHIGSKLLKYVRRKRPHLCLKVFARNENALLFYQRAGFKIVDESFEVSTGQKELLMSWAIGCISGFQKKRQGDS